MKRLPVVLLIFCLSSLSIVYAQTVPVCETDTSDPDGDGWGWENDVSCKVDQSSPDKPSLIDPVTGELVPLQRAEWKQSDLVGTAISCEAQVVYGCGGLSSDGLPAEWDTNWCNGDIVQFTYNGRSYGNRVVYSFYPDGGVQFNDNTRPLSFDEAITEQFEFIEYPVVSNGDFETGSAQNKFAVHLDRDAQSIRQVAGDENAAYPVTRSRLLCSGAIPKDLAGACVDNDGDGWGWNGRESCPVTGRFKLMTDDTPLPETSRLSWSASDLAGKQILCDKQRYNGLSATYVGRPDLYNFDQDGTVQITVMATEQEQPYYFYRFESAWQINSDGSFDGGSRQPFNLPAYPMDEGYVFIDSTFTADADGLRRVNDHMVCTTGSESLRATGSQ